jgi:hypothetical protein
MKPRIPYRKAIRDKHLLGGVVDHVNYAVWDILFLAALGAALTPEERAVFKQFTGRDHEPGARAEELVVVKGRRSGGSSAAGKLLVPYIAGLCKHPSLVKGETGVLLCIAPDQAQASIILDFAAAAFEQSPILRQMVVGRTADSLTLSNGVSIQTRWSHFRRLRGPTYVAVVADECAFWFDADSGSSNSDEEIITAVRPGLASTGGPLIMISSPYARRGLLWEMYSKHHGSGGDPLILVAQGASRSFNATLPQHVVDRALERDPTGAAAEYLAQFRTDIESFVAIEAINNCVVKGLYERPPVRSQHYDGFVDPSGGSADSFTLAIGHNDYSRKIVVLDALREVKPPFSPEATCAEFATLLKSYNIRSVAGDRFAGLWPVEMFAKFGIRYTQNAKAKSELYTDLLPLTNSARIHLLDAPRLLAQLCALERRTSRGGRDSIDHPPGGHDDLANAVAGIAAINNALGGFDTSYQWFNGRKAEGEDEVESWRRLRQQVYIQSHGQTILW